MLHNLSIAMLASPSDFPLLKSWFANHNGLAKDIVIGVDGTKPPPIVAPKSGSRIEIFQCPLNDDFASARNRIIDRCQTDCILFLDADELILPHTKQYLESVVRTVLHHNADFASILEINVFNRYFIDVPTYHSCFINKTKNTRYVNASPYPGASPGCHEKPSGKGLTFSNLQILHLKENWTGNFRDKGYSDINQQAAKADLQQKIEKTK